jgi:hypothetical protein
MGNLKKSRLLLQSKHLPKINRQNPMIPVRFYAGCYFVQSDIANRIINGQTENKNRPATFSGTPV